MSAETRAAEEPVAASTPDASGDAPAPAPEVAEDPVAIAQQALAWCREHPTDDTAVETLNTVFLLKDEPAIKRELLETARIVGGAVAALEEPPATLHAHMTVLLANLLALPTGAAVVDALYAAWIRNPKSFGRGHLTPPRFQQELFVQRLGDLLGWGSLDLKQDHQALVRWAEWFDSWNLRNKFRARRAFDTLRRAFHAPDVWKRVHFEENRPASPRHEHPRHASGQNPESAAPAEPGAEPGVEPGAAPGAEPAPAAVAADPNAPQRKKRRRRRKKKPGEAQPAGAAPAEGAADDSEGDSDGDDGDPGDAAAPNGNV